MYSPFLFVPLLPHPDAGDYGDTGGYVHEEPEYPEDGGFDPDDLY